MSLRSASCRSFNAVQRCMRQVHRQMRWLTIVAVAMLSTTGARAQPANWSPRPHHRGLSLNARADRFLVASALRQATTKPRTLAVACLTGCSSGAEKPARRTLRLRTRDVPARAQRGPGIAAAKDRQRCSARLLQRQRDRARRPAGSARRARAERKRPDSFLGTCSSIPPAGMTGYDEATAEAAGKKP